MNPIQIKTRDGFCPTYCFRPTGSGPWSAVVVFMDGLGIRPAMLEIGERLVMSGYYALLPDLYYRSGPYAPMDPHKVFADPDTRRVDRYHGLVSRGSDVTHRGWNVPRPHCRHGLLSWRPTRHRCARQSSPTRSQDQGARLHRRRPCSHSWTRSL